MMCGPATGYMPQSAALRMTIPRVTGPSPRFTRRSGLDSCMPPTAQ
jgi:hypothetical protein